MEKLKAIVYGVGEMGRISARILDSKGVEIAAAIGNRSNIGKDIGEVAGLGRNTGIRIRNDAETVLAETDADIVVMTVGSTMEGMMGNFRKCIDAGFDIVTIAEEAYYPWTIEPELSAELDALAKEKNVTVSSGGIQDVFWFNLLRAITGACDSIRKIEGIATNNVDEYGPIAAREIGIGLSESEFSNFMENEGGGESDFFGISLEAVTDYFGLKIKESRSWTEPVLADKMTYCKCLDMDIEKGHVTGTVQITEIETEEGICLRTEFCTKILTDGEVETSSWFITGDPDVSVVTENLPGPEATCAAMINRIPDVINADAGLVTVDKLPPIAFRPLSMEKYICK